MNLPNLKQKIKNLSLALEVMTASAEFWERQYSQLLSKAFPRTWEQELFKAKLRQMDEDRKETCSK